MPGQLHRGLQAPDHRQTWLSPSESFAVEREEPRIAGVSSLVRFALRWGLEAWAVDVAVRSGVRDSNGLTNLIFFRRHPELARKALTGSDSASRALMQEWTDIHDCLVQTTLNATRDPITLSDPVRGLIPRLKKFNKGNIPLDVLLGWVTRESNGRLGPPTKLDERGYFQIHPGQSKMLGLNHEKVGSDPDYSVFAGIKLLEALAKEAQAAGFTREKMPFWHVVKLRHSLPVVANAVTAELRREGVTPVDWPQLKQFIANRRRQIWRATGWDPPTAIQSVDNLVATARRIATILGIPSSL